MKLGMSFWIFWHYQNCRIWVFALCRLIRRALYLDGWVASVETDFDKEEISLGEPCASLGKLGFSWYKLSRENQDSCFVNYQVELKFW